jgi:DNA-binding MarR family transcriptional regulator
MLVGRQILGRSIIVNDRRTTDHDSAGREAPAGGRDNIARAMGGTAHAMRRHLDHAMQDVPGRTSAWSVMRHLAHCGPTAQADLARALGIAGSTLTRRLEQMEVDGLIERTDDPNDGRRVIVALSERGEALRQEHRERSRSEIDQLTMGADPADIDALWRVIDVIRANLAALHPDDEWSGRRSRAGGASGPRGPVEQRGGSRPGHPHLHSHPNEGEGV